jgi:hypothetical protein
MEEVRDADGQTDESRTGDRVEEIVVAGGHDDHGSDRDLHAAENPDHAQASRADKHGQCPQGPGHVQRRHRGELVGV